MSGTFTPDPPMDDHGNNNLVIFGHSQSSVIAYREKRKLAEQYPDPKTSYGGLGAPTRTRT